MVGQNVYTDDQIRFVLDHCLQGTPGEEISRQYDEKFRPSEGGKLTANRLRYVKNKYGKDPRFGTILINAVMPKKRRRDASSSTANANTSHPDWLNNTLNTDIVAPATKRPAIASKVLATATLPSNGTFKDQQQVNALPVQSISARAATTATAGPGDFEFTFTPPSYTQKLSVPDRVVSANDDSQSKLSFNVPQSMPANHPGASFLPQVYPGDAATHMKADQGMSHTQFPPMRVPPYTENVTNSLYSDATAIDTYRGINENMSLAGQPRLAPAHAPSPPNAAQAQFVPNLRSPRMPRGRYHPYQQYHHNSPRASYQQRRTDASQQYTLPATEPTTYHRTPSYEAAIDPLLSNGPSMNPLTATSLTRSHHNWPNVAAPRQQHLDHLPSFETVMYSNAAQTNTQACPPIQMPEPSTQHDNDFYNQWRIPENEQMASGTELAHHGEPSQAVGEAPAAGSEPDFSDEFTFASELLSPGKTSVSITHVDVPDAAPVNTTGGVKSTPSARAQQVAQLPLPLEYSGPNTVGNTVGSTAWDEYAAAGQAPLGHLSPTLLDSHHHTPVLGTNTLSPQGNNRLDRTLSAAMSPDDLLADDFVFPANAEQPAPSSNEHPGLPDTEDGSDLQKWED